MSELLKDIDVRIRLAETLARMLKCARERAAE